MSAVLERPVLWPEKMGGDGGIIEGYFKCFRSSNFQYNIWFKYTCRSFESVTKSVGSVYLE